MKKVIRFIKRSLGVTIKAKDYSQAEWRKRGLVYNPNQVIKIEVSE